MALRWDAQLLTPLGACLPDAGTEQVRIMLQKRYRAYGPISEEARTFDAGMHAMLAAMSQLQHLRSLAMSEEYSSNIFRSLQQMPFLTKLVVQTYYPSKESIFELARLTGLKALAIPYPTAEFMSSCLPSLHDVLELKLGVGIGGPLPALPLLMRLELCACDLPDAVMWSIGSNLPALRHLKIQATVSDISTRRLDPALYTHVPASCLCYHEPSWCFCRSLVTDCAWLTQMSWCGCAENL